MDGNVNGLYMKLVPHDFYTACWKIEVQCQYSDICHMDWRVIYLHKITPCISFRPSIHKKYSWLTRHAGITSLYFVLKLTFFHLLIVDLSKVMVSIFCEVVAFRKAG